MTSTRNQEPRPRWPHLAWVALVAAACATEPTPQHALPPGAVPVVARAEYRDWWARTATCAGVIGHFDQIEWYTVPDARTMTTEIGEKVGLWVRHDGRRMIIIAEAYLDHELVVRHEMLHDILERAGHPEEYFVSRCGLTWDSWAPPAVDAVGRRGE